jgi:hypothetical protein
MARNQKVADAERKQVEAWKRWNDDPSDANMAAWDRAVENMRDAQDEAECQSDRMDAVRESEQAPWWVAAKHNARVSM